MHVACVRQRDPCCVANDLRKLVRCAGRNLVRSDCIYCSSSSSGRFESVVRSNLRATGVHTDWRSYRKDACLEVAATALARQPDRRGVRKASLTKKVPESSEAVARKSTGVASLPKTDVPQVAVMDSMRNHDTIHLTGEVLVERLKRCRAATATLAKQKRVHDRVC